MTAATSPRSLTLWEKIDLIPGLLSLVGAALSHLLSGPFRGETGAYKYRTHVTHGIVRQALYRFNAVQLQHLSGPFSRTYDRWCQTNDVVPKKVVLRTGTEAFWVGDPEADFVILYYHGGGFSLEGGPEHLDFWGGEVYQDLKRAGKSVSFLFLQYTLVPHGVYPVQVKEAIESVRYLTQDLKRSASTIILGGDSAGGNMCLGVLSQIMHPSPDLPKIEIDKPFKAFVLIAPWLRFLGHSPSSINNHHKDIVFSALGRRWSEGYLAGQQPTPYIEPGIAEASWWKDPPLGHILVVAGEDEVLFDSVDYWVELYKSVNGADSMTFIVGEHEAHIASIIEPRLGDHSPTQQGEGIKAWLKSQL